MLRIFERGNWAKHKSENGEACSDACPVCGTQKEGKVVLIPISGTENDGIAEAIQIHLDCLELWFNKEHKFIFQKINKKNEEEE